MRTLHQNRKDKRKLTNLRKMKSIEKFAPETNSKMRRAPELRQRSVQHGWVCFRKHCECEQSLITLEKMKNMKTKWLFYNVTTFIVIANMGWSTYRLRSLALVHTLQKLATMSIPRPAHSSFPQRIVSPDNAEKSVTN